MSNLFFPIFEKIEKEVLELSSAIYFTDTQSSVYSSYIADLIIRASVEIESIAKEIYRKETGVEPKTPGECILWMEKQWKITRKAVQIVTSQFHFEENSCRNFAHLIIKMVLMMIIILNIMQLNMIELKI